MTDYVKSTNFASKDSLATGNPLKIVKGTEIDTEFNNIATAVATKADINSPTFTGTPLAPTAAGGTNTTQIATTAFVQTALQALYPVGSIYINASSSTNPATLLGFGTWTAFGAGKVLVSQDASDALFDTLEETGGSKDAIVVSHNHGGVSGGQSVGHTHTFSGTTVGSGAHSHSINDPGHTHNVPASMYVAATPSSVAVHDTTPTQNQLVPTQSSGTGISINSVGDHSHTYSGTTSGTSGDHTHSISTQGSSGTNANVQPYIVVKMWKRTA